MQTIIATAARAHPPPYLQAVRRLTTAAQQPKQADRGPRVHAVLGLELPRPSRIEHRERQLLARRAQPARGLVSCFSACAWIAPVIPPVCGTGARTARIGEHDGRRRLAIRLDRIDGHAARGGRGREPDRRAPPRPDEEHCGQQRERGGDQIGDPERVQDGDDHDVVEPARETVVDRGVGRELGAPLVDRLAQRGARAGGVDVLEQARRELQLLQRIDLGVEDERGALQDRAIRRVLEPRGGDRREDREHDEDARVARDEVARRVAEVAVGRQGRQRKPHAEAREHLRHDRPRDPRRGQERERGRAASEQHRARERPRRLRPGDRERRQRRDGQHAHAQRGPQRRDREARDELDHEQEQHRGERCGDEPEPGELRDRGPVGRGGGRRSRSAGGAAAGVRITAMAAAAASGAWTAKIARQSSTSVSTPPIAGPAAVPTSAAASQIRRPSRDVPASSTTYAVSSNAAAPAAWSARKTSSSQSEPAIAQPTDAAANTQSPSGPGRSRRAGRIASARTSA